MIAKNIVHDLYSLNELYEFSDDIKTAILNQADKLSSEHDSDYTLYEVLKNLICEIERIRYMSASKTSCKIY